jgi:hypothetical protein
VFFKTRLEISKPQFEKQEVSMNIESASYNTIPTIGYAINASQGGRMSVPVSPSSYIYSQFKHVSGVPAPEGVQGVNISRLKIIDTLIEQLTQMKKPPEPLLSVKAQDGEDAVDVLKSIDSMIEQYQNQVRTLQENRANSPYALTPPPTGALFNIFV